MQTKNRRILIILVIITISLIFIGCQTANQNTNIDKNANEVLSTNSELDTAIENAMKGLIKDEVVSPRTNDETKDFKIQQELVRLKIISDDMSDEQKTEILTKARSVLDFGLSFVVETTTEKIKTTPPIQEASWIDYFGTENFAIVSREDQVWWILQEYRDRIYLYEYDVQNYSGDGSLFDLETSPYFQLYFDDYMEKFNECKATTTETDLLSIENNRKPDYTFYYDKNNEEAILYTSYLSSINIIEEVNNGGIFYAGYFGDWWAKPKYADWIEYYGIENFAIIRNEYGSEYDVWWILGKYEDGHSFLYEYAPYKPDYMFLISSAPTFDIHIDDYLRKFDELKSNTTEADLLTIKDNEFPDCHGFYQDKDMYHYYFSTDTEILYARDAAKYRYNSGHLGDFWANEEPTTTVDYDEEPNVGSVFGAMSPEEQEEWMGQILEDGGYYDESGGGYTPTNPPSEQKPATTTDTWTLPDSYITTLLGQKLWKVPVDSLFIGLGVTHVNVTNPGKIKLGCKIKIAAEKDMWGNYKTYKIDDDGKEGGLVYKVIDVTVID